MLNVLQAIVATLEKHRIARRWDNTVVAADLATELGLDPDSHAEHATAAIDPDRVSDDQVADAEAAAKRATDDAAKLRAKLDLQNAPAKAEAERTEALRIEAERVARIQADQEAANLAADRGRTKANDAARQQPAFDAQVVPVPAMPAPFVEHQDANTPHTA